MDGIAKTPAKSGHARHVAQSVPTRGRDRNRPPNNRNLLGAFGRSDEMGPSSAVISRRAALLLAAPLWAPAALRPSPAAAAARGVTAPSGVRYIDFKDGTGATPRFGQVVRFHYVGYVSGEKGGLDAFDSSYDRNKPYLTKHGNGLTVQGLEEALHTMRVGGQRRVIVPAPLGYTADKGPLPPRSDQRNKLDNAIERGASLVFDLELISASDDLLDRGDYDVRPAASRASQRPRGRVTAPCAVHRMKRRTHSARGSRAPKEGRRWRRRPPRLPIKRARHQAALRRLWGLTRRCSVGDDGG